VGRALVDARYRGEKKRKNYSETLLNKDTEKAGITEGRPKRRKLCGNENSRYRLRRGKTIRELVLFLGRKKSRWKIPNTDRD